VIPYIYIHTYTYIIVIYSGLMSLRTAKPLEDWGKKCLIGREGKLKQECLLDGWRKQAEWEQR